MRDPEVISEWTDYLSIVDDQIQPETVIEVILENGSTAEVRRATSEDISEIDFPVSQGMDHSKLIVVYRDGKDPLLGMLHGAISANAVMYVGYYMMLSPLKVKSIRAKELKQDQNLADTLEVVQTHFDQLDGEIDWLEFIREGTREKFEIMIKVVNIDVGQEERLIMEPTGEEISSLELDPPLIDIESKVSRAAMMLIGQIIHGEAIEMTKEEFMKVVSLFSKFIQNRSVDIGGSIQSFGGDQKIHEAQMLDGTLKVQFNLRHMLNDILLKFNITLVEEE